MSVFRKDINGILSRIQNGDQSGKAELFEKTYNHLKAIAYRYLRDKNDVEDVLSEAYLKAFSSIHAFDKSKDGYNWLCKIVQNIAYDLNEKTLACLPLDERFVVADESDFETALSQSDEIWRWLKDCDERDKRIVYLKFWEDYSYSEIAKLMGMKRSNVHKRVSVVTSEILKKIQNRVDDR